MLKMRRRQMTHVDAYDPILSEVLAHYPLVNSHDLVSVESSGPNDTFTVQANDRGRYVLRHYRRNQDESRVAFQLRFQQHLFRQGFPIPQVLLAEDGQTFVVVGQQPWALFSFIEGQEYDYASPQQVIEAGRRLAQLHLAATSFDETEIAVGWGGNFRSFWIESSDVVGFRDLFARRDVEDDLAFWLSWWQWARETWPIERVETLPYGWIHGDYHGQNLKFTGDRMVGLFDFDVIFRGPSALDAAYGMVMFARERPHSYVLRQEFAKLFLGAYQESRALKAVEIESMPVLVLANLAGSISLFRHHHRLGDDVSSALHKRVGIMRTPQLQLNQLAPAFGWSTLPKF